MKSKKNILSNIYIINRLNLNIFIICLLSILLEFLNPFIVFSCSIIILIFNIFILKKYFEKKFYLVFLYFLFIFICKANLFLFLNKYPLNTLLIPSIAILLFKNNKKEFLKDIFFETTKRIEKKKNIKSFIFEILIITTLTSFTLIYWHKYFSENNYYFFQNLKTKNLFTVIPFILFFSSINAFIEEFAFRGIIQNILKKNLPLFLTLFVQGIWFGASHFTNGFPNNYLGVILASLYGIYLGTLKYRSNNLFLCIITHIFADITILLLIFS